MRRVLLAASLAVPAAACTGSVGSRQHAASPAPLETYVSQPAASAPAPGHASAVAMLPSGAGAIAQVRERAYQNGFGQEIAFRDGGKGLNRVEITVAAQAGSAGPNPAPMAKPSEAGVKAEIAARFPGVPMQVVAQPRANAYGPYGLAVGRPSGAVRCLYAWQWIDNLRSAPGAAGAGQAASVRVRLCRSDATLDQLASHVDQLAIDLTRRAAVPASLEHAARPPAGEAALRKPPEPVRAESLEPAKRSAAERQPRRVAEIGLRPPSAEGATSGTERADGRRYLAPVQPSRAASVASPAAVEWARIGRPPSGASRLGAAENGAGLASASAAAIVSSPRPAGPSHAANANKPKSLDAGLPTRAYLGPGAPPIKAMAPREIGTAAPPTSSDPR